MSIPSLTTESLSSPIERYDCLYFFVDTMYGIFFNRIASRMAIFLSLPYI